MTGQQIGPYRVVREIGRGGMGSVFEAIQPQIERRVAIKVLRAEFAQNQQLVHRFFTEARAVNIVNHPSVVQISEFGQLPDGLAYIVMEFLEGESLGARMKRQGGKLTITESLRLCRQVAAALAAAHSKGIIHRDLKPDNIMIVHDPEAPGGERAKVLDFGIAKVFDAARADQSVTTTGSMVGTPLYMAPEQCRGGGNITDKADVYALGIMLYRMLCGRPPFIGDGSGAVLAMHIYEQPPPLRQFEPSIPDDLAGLVHSLLAKEPQQRPSMAQVAVALEQLKAIHSTGMLSTTDLGLSSGAIYLQHPRTPAPLSQSQILAGLGQMHGSSPSNPTPNPTGNHAIPGTGPSNSVSMTLGSSAAQIAPPPPPRRVPVVALIAVGIFAVVGGAVFGLMAISKPAEKPALRQVQAVPATPRSVRFKVESEPPGATVVRATDQQILGSTPWQFSQPAGSGQLILLLKKQGYADRVVTIDQSANAVVKENLQALVVNMPAPPPVDPTPVAPTGPGKGKWKKGKASGPAGKPAAPETGSTPTQPAATATPTPQPTPPPPPPKEDSHGSRIQVVD